MDPVIVDLAVKVLMFILTVAMGVIAYFVKDIYQEHKKMRADVEAAARASEAAAAATRALDAQLTERLRSVKAENEVVYRGIAQELTYLRQRYDRMDERVLDIQKSVSAIVSNQSIMIEALPKIQDELSDMNGRMGRLEGRG